MTRLTALAAALSCAIAHSTSASEPTQLLWGDTHLHTSYSFDAFLNQNRSADPDTAYRWAKGLPVIHPYHRAKVQVETPLDFLVVADHAEMMGVMRAIENNTAELDDLGLIGNLKRWFAIRVLRGAMESGNEGSDVFVSFLPKKAANPSGDPVQDAGGDVIGDPIFGDTTKTETTAWGDIVDAAERHNEPGKFTTLIGWEWSSIPTGANLHRVVFTPDGGDIAKKFLPYGSDQSQYPQALWQWLEDTQARTGARFIAIPHNSNISKGYMFAETTLRNEPMDLDYIKTRMKWEPVAEVTQIKGDSETHPAVSPNDEFADFETYSHYIQQDKEEYVAKPADYVRGGLKQGLAIEQKVGANPYKFGMIGSTDAHTGIASAEEDNFWGKLALDSTPESKKLFPEMDEESDLENMGANGWSMSASGLAAVWAKENTRDEIFAAFQRKEVYATTGPRIQVRLFGGWEFPDNADQAENLADIGYANGVPMGGDLNREDAQNRQPQFLVHAVKDPKSANLDRVQIIKGWVDSKGQQHEQVYNVAWSDERELGADGKLPAVGNTVDLKTGAYTNNIGSTQLTTVWTDPDFDAEQRAFYYVRVLQIPTPRHSLYDAIALQSEVPAEGPATIQERAYTSPIWYTP
ncbi:DUF3604 domain-containing protein [Maricurvus nonylphenolicus]|uniref:DUF3604 domain-containing protein n=1 Tax=Maricurvus nonylphenolicus TaxID=1008307 RepID=UPI0036F44F01